MADVKEMGEEKMLELVNMRYAGLRKISKTFNSERIDYKNFGGYELFEKDGQFDKQKLEKDSKYLNKVLRKSLNRDRTFQLADKKIKKFGFAGLNHLVENKLEGQLHSGKLTQALIKDLQKKGVEFLFGVEVKGFEKASGKIELETNQYFNLSASQLIFCTNTFTGKLLPELEVTPARGQVLVTAEIPQLDLKGTFHYDEGYYYFRNLGKRILLGGARNKFADEERTTDLNTSNNIQSELERFLRTIILPGRENISIDYRWSGIMGMGREKTPTIGEMEPNIFCAVAMGGIGVAVSPIVAEQVSKLLLRKKG
jgi:glycine/D-amino acid oxidase-like deaminating enzyme